MAEVWIEEAEDLRARGSSGAMRKNHKGVKVTWHVTVSTPGESFDAMHKHLTKVKAEPHVLYDPLTDQLGQYFPLNRSARALRNDGQRKTNRDGLIHVQVEVVAMPDGFTDYWKPGPNFQALMRAIRSWGVPDEWPAGPLAVSGGWDDQVSRSWVEFEQSGHFGHCNVPGNDHWDPGNIDQIALLDGAPGRDGGAQSLPVTVPKSSSRWKPTGKLSVKEVQKVVKVKADGIYGPKTEAAVRNYQRERGVPADGLWGPKTEAAHVSGKRRNGAKLVVDGIEGKNTVRALQRLVDVKVDGIRGRQTDRALQEWLDVQVDGIVGENTIEALQRRVGASVDGIWGEETTRKLQQFLNEKG